jgi:hypothetical protein
MPPQTYNHYTKCVEPKDYSGPYLWSAGMIALIVLGGLAAIFDPGSITLTLSIGIIGYCRWFLYGRLVCLGGNQCLVGLALSVHTQEDQTGFGKFDTDYSVYILPAPNPLYGDPVYGVANLNDPAHPGKTLPTQWTTELDATTTVQRKLLADPSKFIPVNAAFAQMLTQYQATFEGEPCDGSFLFKHANVNVYGPLSKTQLSSDQINLPCLVWQPNNNYAQGDKIVDGNGDGNLQTCISNVADQLSGPTEPVWGNTNGATVNDGQVQWSCGPTPKIAAIEVEFEGAGVWDLYNYTLAAVPIAAVGAILCMIPFIGWLVCLILSLVAAAVITAGMVVGLGDSSAVAQAKSQVGNILPLQSVLFVMGTWIFDSGHEGYNELHPVLFCQIIGNIKIEDVLSGNAYRNHPQFGPAEIQSTINAYCGMAKTQLNPATVALQRLPQNTWTIHPLVDGCTPTPPVVIP